MHFLGILMCSCFYLLLLKISFTFTDHHSLIASDTILILDSHELCYREEIKACLSASTGHFKMLVRH